MYVFYVCFNSIKLKTFSFFYFHIMINYKLSSPRFKVVSNHSKTIKSEYFKVESDHFNIITLKDKKYILNQPNRDDFTVKSSYLKISDNLNDFTIF